MIHEFLWLDCETTGLLGREPGDLDYGGRILEVAAAVALDCRGGDFVIEDLYTSTVACAPLGPVGEWPYKQHLASGLLLECASASAPSLAVVEDDLIAFVHGYRFALEPIVLAGNSVHFDLQWIRRHMQRFAALLHHRVFDVSTLNRVADTYSIGVHPAPVKTHRALDDVRESLAIAKAWVSAASGA